MKIELTALLSDAKKIASITKNNYLIKDNITSEKKSHENLLKKVDNIKQKLFSLQSNISENQSIQEALKEIHQELIHLNKEYNDANLKIFYENIYKIAQRYNYLQKDIIYQEFIKPFYEKNIEKKDINKVIKKILDVREHIDQSVEIDKLNLMKLQISSENILSLTTADENLFNQVKEIFKPSHIELLKNVHLIRDNFQLNRILTKK